MLTQMIDHRQISPRACPVCKEGGLMSVGGIGYITAYRDKTQGPGSGGGSSQKL